MGRKTKELSLVCKDRIVSLFKQGLSYRKIGTILNLSFATVQCVIKKIKTTNSIENNKRSGRPRVLSIRDSWNLLQKVSRNPEKSARKLAKTSLQQLVNTSAFRPFEITSTKVVTKEERQEKNTLSMNETGGNGWNSNAPM
jgi:transposase